MVMQIRMYKKKKIQEKKKTCNGYSEIDKKIKLFTGGYFDKMNKF